MTMIRVKLIADLELKVEFQDPDYPDADKIMRRKVDEYSKDPGPLISHPRSVVSITGRVEDKPRFFESD